MSCCSCFSARELVDSEVKEETEEDDKSLQDTGFVVKRRCTDALCLLIWAGHLVIFLAVSLWGMRDGNPSKLYQPRDYQGSYCGLETNWNNGPNLRDQTKQGYMMNVTSMTDTIAKQFLCSSAVSSFLLGSTGLNEEDALTYQTACCLIPNYECKGSLALGGDIEGQPSATNQNLNVITEKMADLTNPFSGFNLWSAVGANQGAFSDIWSEATKYFIKTCLPSCTVNTAALNSSSARFYTYSPPPDDVLFKAWTTTANHFANTTFMDTFKFRALPPSVCPYAAEFCIPLPGVELEELSTGYCTIAAGVDMRNAVGDFLASRFESLGGDSFVESATETFGAWFGDFEKSIDTFVLVCLCSFVVALVYLVLLRFTVKFCVWFAVFFIFLMLVTGGALSWARSVQCKGATLSSTATQTGTAVAVAGATTMGNLLSGTAAVSEDCSASLFCSDYRGVQTRTRSGILCQAWDATKPHNHNMTYSSALFPDSGLNSTPGTLNNYCRNPYDPAWVNDTSAAAPPSSIWCFTTNPGVRWELCTPIGIVAPQCEHGYAVPGENARKALEILAIIIWVSAGIWALLVLCFKSRIRLAIALNAVAANFVSDTPTIVIVPMLQTIVGCAWVLVWMLLASFLLSQVPASYTPTQAYATYAEAYGTDTTPGACTDRWPTGFVYRTATEECDMSDAAAGPKCWRCAPPRYILDMRFALSFFAFLWNNAFLVALGQCMIAGAVGVWFFTPNSQKGLLWRGQALRQANWNVWRYHAGSLAFGSFILAVIQFIRYLMKYLEKQAGAQKNRIMVLVMKVLQCAILCFERFIKFLNKNAYIQVAIRGTAFCTSAKRAFQIITANILRFGTVAVLGQVVHCIGYFFIMVATLTSGYFLLNLMHDDISPVIPLVIYGFMSYLVGKLFMNVFGLAVDTCLQCVIFAEEKCPDGDFVAPCLRKVIDRSTAPDPDEPEKL